LFLVQCALKLVFKEIDSVVFCLKLHTSKLVQAVASGKLIKGR